VRMQRKLEIGNGGRITIQDNTFSEALPHSYEIVL
jgi:hypothetical protein